MLLNMFGRAALNYSAHPAPRCLICRQNNRMYERGHSSPSVARQHETRTKKHTKIKSSGSSVRQKPVSTHTSPKVRNSDLPLGFEVKPLSKAAASDVDCRITRIPLQTESLEEHLKRFSDGVAQGVDLEFKSLLELSSEGATERLSRTKEENELWSKQLNAFSERVAQGDTFKFEVPAISEELPPLLIENEELSAKNQKRKRRTPVNIVTYSTRNYHLNRHLNAEVTENDEELVLTPLEMTRSHMYNEDLISYIDVCLHAGLVERAHRVLSYSYLYKYAAGVKTHVINDSLVFEKLIQCWINSTDGSLERGLQVYKLLLDLNVSPTMDIFVKLLELAQKSEKTSVKDNVIKVVQLLTEQGLRIKYVVMHSKLKNNRIAARRITEMLESAIPGVVIKQCVPKSCVGYDNSLVNQLIDCKERINSFSLLKAGTRDDRRELIDRHITMEQAWSLSVKSVQEIVSADPSTEALKRKYKELLQLWRESITKAFEKFLIEEEAKMNDRKICMYPFLKLLPVSQYVDLMMNEVEMIVCLHELHSPEMSQLSVLLGKAVQRQHIVNKLKSGSYGKHMQSVIMKYYDKLLSPTLSEQYRDVFLSCGEDEDFVDLFDVDKPWTYYLNKQVGQKLYDIILKRLQIPTDILSTDRPLQETSFVPAFYSVFRKRKTFLASQIKPSPLTVQLIKKAQINDITLHMDDIPTAIPPLPWMNQDVGCFYLNRTVLLRQNMEHYFGRSDPKTFQPVLDAISELSACPWTVSKRILETVKTLYNDPKDYSIDGIPPDPDTLELPLYDSCSTVEEWSKMRTERFQVMRKHKELRSIRCMLLLSLSVAEKMKDTTFWFPHNLDFRGRAYPISPYLSHIGSDPIRGMMRFATGKPLGERGLEWLKIHLVNLTGLKKRETNNDRLAYFDELQRHVLQSAATPLEGEQWWQQQEDPFQVLSACFELKSALESENPYEFVSYLPIHQDGSCNGLQHYAALGRDPIGAKSVNVAPNDKPHDVYTDVVEEMETLRKIDAASGRQLAQGLEGILNRKVVKQSVMTTVYGVTSFGIREQIGRQLREQYDMPMERVGVVRNYFASLLSTSLGKIFKASTDIQDWLTLVAYLIVTETGKPVTWKTPLGLPVTQSYWKANSGKCNPFNQGKLEPDSRKQKNGFPPNFIHSLDSSHMMLTALHCQQQGITFAAVHDCYWTHAADIDLMNKICRQQFASLHSQPILKNLSSYLIKQYEINSKDHELLYRVLNNVPKQGTFDINTVLDSTYFFS